MGKTYRGSSKKEKRARRKSNRTLRDRRKSTRR